MAQQQLNEPRPPQSEEDSFDKTSQTELDETRPPDPTHSEQPPLSLPSAQEQASLSLPPGSPGSEENTPDIDQHSLSLSPPQAQEEGIPDHEFDIKITEGKSGRMKGVTRQKVSLIIGNHIFRKRRVEKSGLVSFTCNGCETSIPKRYISAFARVNEDGSYELVEWPRMEDHTCWADINKARIRKARNEMFEKVQQHPSKSCLQIYEEVRNSFTQDMDSQEKLLFLSDFPTFRDVQSNLYKKRRELIPPNPKKMIDLKLDLSLFLYSDDESVVKGDQLLDDGRRIVLLTTNAHLNYLAKSEQVLADGTFRITPIPWCQSFIISVQVTSGVFIPVAFCLLPDKKRETYDAMFGMLAECLESRGLQLSATYFMSGMYNTDTNIELRLILLF